MDDVLLQLRSCGLRAFTPTTVLRHIAHLMIPLFIEVVHAQLDEVMHDAVAECGCDDFSNYRMCDDEAEALRRAIGAGA
jgi:hypothetical protein